MEPHGPVPFGPPAGKPKIASTRPSVDPVHSVDLPIRLPDHLPTRPIMTLLRLLAVFLPLACLGTPTDPGLNLRLGPGTRVLFIGNSLTYANERCEPTCSRPSSFLTRPTPR